MDWIKTKYDRAILLVVSLLLVASSAFIFLKTKSIGEIFASYLAPFSQSSKIESVNTQPITAAREALEKPAKWSAPENKYLLVAEPYLLKDGLLVPFIGAGPIHEPIPNDWFKKYGLDLMARDALQQDPDSDRYTNLEEWGNGTNSTNPSDPKSHPPLTNKLRLKQYIQIPFRLIFKARDGETVQINTIDLKQPSQFLRVGDQIAGTKFSITKLDIKAGVDNYGSPRDTSELTIQHQETKAEIILVLGIIANSPDTYALFKYLYDESEFKVRKDGVFKLTPDNETIYKLFDISSSEAVITTPTSEKLTIPKL